MVRDDLRRGIAAVFLTLVSISAAQAQTPALPAFRLTVDQILRPADAEMVQGGSILEPDFGRSVAVGDNVALLGIRGFNDPDGPAGPQLSVGRVGVWTHDGTDWQRTGTIDPPAGLPTARFGGRIALGPSRAFVSSHPDRVDVFARNGNLWVHEQRLTAGDPAPPGEVSGLAFDAGWLVIRFSELPGVQVYARRNGFWQRVQTVEASSGRLNPTIGPALAIADGMLVVGDPFRTRTGNTFVYRLNSSGVWTLRQVLTPPDGNSNDSFGWSVATKNGMIAVGAIGTDRLAEPMCGQAGVGGGAYVYAPSGPQWVFTQKLSHLEVSCHYQLGMEVAITPTHLAVRSYTLTEDYRASTILYLRNGPVYELFGQNDGSLYAGDPNEGIVALTADWLFAGIPVGFPDLSVSGRVETYELARNPPTPPP